MGRHASLVSTGCYVPSREITNSTLAGWVRAESAEIERLEQKTGILRRFYAPDDWSTSDLALPAATQAIVRAGLAPEDIDLILLGTDTPDYITPSTSVVLQHKLGAKNAGTFDVGCACASFPTALSAAAGILATNTFVKHILVVGAYLMHRLADPADPTTFFYGDGAGAAVVSASEEVGFLGAAYRADGAYARNWCIESGGTVEPASVASVTEGRTKVRLRERFPRHINDDGWPRLVHDLARRTGLAPSDFDLLLFTQVRKETIENVMHRLELPIERAHTIMEKWGYTGSACIPMALHDAIDQGKVRRGSRIAMIGSGVGYNQAAVAFQIGSALHVGSAVGAPA